MEITQNKFSACFKEARQHPFLILAALCLGVGVIFRAGSVSLIREGVVLLLFGLIILAACGSVIFWQKKILSGDNFKIALISLLFITTVFILLCKMDYKIFFLLALSVCILLCITYLLYINKKLSSANIILLIAVAGFILRAGYILYTSVQNRQHDVESFGSGHGHAGYIEYIYNNSRLPKGNPVETWQFYHPPLHHIICALWLKLQVFIGIDYSSAIENLQLLTLFYSSSIMLICVKIFKLFKMKGAALITAFALIAFHPTFIILSGSINNDILSITLAFAAIYNALKWYNDPQLRSIIYIALCVGGSMLAKLSGALVAPAIAIIFLCKLFSDRAGRKNIFRQLTIFAVICVPIGLIWGIVNLIVYKMPLTYVPDLRSDNFQYIGDLSLTERLFGMKNQFKSIFFAFGIRDNVSYLESNAFIALLKSSVFGEYTLAEKNTVYYFICAALLYVNLAAVIISFISFFSALISKNTMSTVLKLFFAVLFLTVLGSYISFCLAYPYSCTQNIRYAVPLLLIHALFTGLAVQRFSKKRTRLELYAYKGTIAVTTIFCALSALTYIGLAG